MLLAKNKLNTVEVLISKAFIDSNISDNEFIVINNVLEEYDDMKEEIENPSNVKWIFIVLNV